MAAVLPCVTVVSLAESVKLGAIRLIATVLLAVSVPEVPVIVIEPLQDAAVLLAVSVNTLVVAVGFLLQDAVTPVGRPLTVNVTLPLNPF